MWSGIPCHELMAAWDQFFERGCEVPDKLGKYLVRTCALRVLQLVDGQDAQAMLLLEHFQCKE